jgi:hypothetical protein
MTASRTDAYGATVSVIRSHLASITTPPTPGERGGIGPGHLSAPLLPGTGEDWRAGPDRRGVRRLHLLNPAGRTWCGKWTAAELEPPGAWEELERCGGCERTWAARCERERR